MCKDMDRLSPGESQASREPHENSPQKAPDKAERHRQKGPIVSNTAQLTHLKMSLPARAVIRCQRMETQYNSFEKRSHKNYSNSHIQTLDSGDDRKCAYGEPILYNLKLRSNINTEPPEEE